MVNLDSRQACFERRPDNIIEQKCAIDKHHEADDLQPFKGFPSKSEGNQPDKQCSASVDGATSSSRYRPSNREAEVVKATDKSQG